MKVKSRLSKIIAILGLATATIGAVNVLSTKPVEASDIYYHHVGKLHYLRKDHKTVAKGYTDGLPTINQLKNGKFWNDSDNPQDPTTFADGNLKANGYRYINGHKYFNFPVKGIDIKAFLIAAKYFTKKYNDQSYQTIYVATRKTPWANCSPSKDASEWKYSLKGMYLYKGLPVMINNLTKTWPLVECDLPANYKYFDFGMGTPSDSVASIRKQDLKYLRKAGKNVRYYFSPDEYYTNSSLKRGGFYHRKDSHSKYHFYKYYQA